MRLITCVWMLVPCLFVLTVAISSSHAQVMAQIAEVQEDQEEQDDRQQSLLSKAKKLEVGQLMAIHLEEMRQICDLSEDQVKRLGIAAKGVAQRRTKKWMKQMGQVNFGGMIIDEEEGEERENNDALEQQMMQEMFSMIVFNHMQSKPIDEDRLWRKTVEKVLTEQQLQKLDHAREARLKNRRDTVVNYLVGVVDNEFRLSAEQHAKFKGLVDKKIGSKIKTSRGMFEDQALIYQLYQLPQEEIKSILNPPQLKRWSMYSQQFAGVAFVFVEDDAEVEESEEVEMEDTDK